MREELYGDNTPYDRRGRCHLRGAGTGGAAADTTYLVRVAKAAGTSLASPSDSITVNNGEYLLVISGVNVGLWRKTSAGWGTVEAASVVAVKEGATYGRLLWFLNAAGTAYERNYAEVAPTA